MLAFASRAASGKGDAVSLLSLPACANWTEELTQPVLVDTITTEPANARGMCWKMRTGDQ